MKQVGESSLRRTAKKIISKYPFMENVIYVGYKLYCVVMSIPYFVCRIFPIQSNKIVCCNMKGKRYGDNPKYIIDELISKNENYELVWLLKDVSDPNVPSRVRVVPYDNLWKTAYELATAKIWIDTNLKEQYVHKRKGQYYIQTWHGSYGLKKVACDVKDGQKTIDVKTDVYNMKMQDIMISNSRRTTEIYRSAFRYHGKVLEIGSPRNDIFFEEPQQYKEKVKQAFGIENKKMVLYAPTFRADLATDALHMEIENVLNALAERWGGEWVMLIRLHPQNINDAAHFITYSDSVINATNYDVMQELLVAADVLISDYSSCMFDFVTVEKPCFIYATDIEKYKGERDFYFNIRELPFPVAENNAEMERNILAFDENTYHEKLQQLHESVGLCDRGEACEKVVEYIKGLE